MNHFLKNNTRKYVTASSVSFILSLLVLNSCARLEKKRVINFPKTDLTKTNLIPKPFKIIATYDGLALDEFTSIQTATDDEDFKDVGRFLADKIKFKTGLSLPVNNAKKSKKGSIVYIKQIDPTKIGGAEAYHLSINKDSIILSAQTAAGAFRGIQTIRQIIPEMSNDTLAENRIWVIPTGWISDAPQFEYRGAMLDVSRHFFSVADVKKYIDVLSYYKFNVLHLHLSDDQGWRIEIKSWPKLTEIGARSEVGGESGGFYTQEEYTEIDDQRFYGFKQLSLSSNYSDNSFLREKVAADIFRESGVPAAQTAFYQVYVDYGEGPIYFGLYNQWC